MHSLRQRCRSKLPPQAVLGTVLHKKLCSQLRTTVELQVSYICREDYVTTLIGTIRYHTVQEFNKGVYDYIIATDESGSHEQDEEGEGEEEALDPPDDTIEDCW